MRPREENRRLVAVPSSMELSRAKTRATAEAWGKEPHFYKPLPTQFRHDGFEYRQIGRERDAAIYEQRWGGALI